MLFVWMPRRLLRDEFQPPAVQSKRPVPAGRFALGVSVLDIPGRERGRAWAVHVAGPLPRHSDPQSDRVAIAPAPQHSVAA